ncbi:MAG: FeoA family protein [Spirochaetes bacterium]|jgi:ferrous iron transport protein A|nr:FeoA family protein [Spirochaetota bacterium]
MEKTVRQNLPLSMAKPGSSYKILKIEGGEKFKSKMISMGIFPEKTVEIMNCDGCVGPIAIKIGFSKVVLGRGMAQKITVSTM